MLTYNTLFMCTIFGVCIVMATTFIPKLSRLWKYAVIYLNICIILLLVYAWRFIA